MPGWGLALLVGFLLLAAVGAALRVATPAPEPVVESFDGEAGTGFLPRSDAPMPEPAPLTWQQRLHELSPILMRVGLVFAVGFVIGYAFRSFLKTAAMLAAVAVVGLLVLSWTGILHVDMTTMQERYHDTAAWLAGETQRLLEHMLTHVPSTLSGIAGAITGFLRR